MPKPPLTPSSRSRLAWQGPLMRLAVCAYAGSFLVTAWLYLGGTGDSIAHLLLELGPRWLVALGFLPLLLMPMQPRWRAVAAATGVLLTVALMDVRVWGCIKPDGADYESLHVGSYNTGGGFVPPTELLLWYDEQRLDLLLMQELGKPERLQEAAQALGMNLSCHSKLCALTQHSISGELILNRQDLGGWGGYAARFDFCKSGRCWPLVNLHLATPRHAIEEVLGRQPFDKARGFLKMRELESSLASLATRDPNALIAGDFNMTQQSPLYRAHWRDWQNAFDIAGCGVGGTKFSARLETRIDHILAGNRWRVLKSTVHDALGGDHRPITATLAPKAPEKMQE